MPNVNSKNKKVLLVLGEPETGKTTSLAWLLEEYGDKTAIINFDKKSRPLFNLNKANKVIEPKDPLEVLPGAKALEENDEIDFIVLDSMSFWIEAIERKYIVHSDDSRSAWSKIYADTIYRFLDFINGESNKTWIILSHVIPSSSPFVQTKAEVKGSLGKRGIEAFFDVVVYTRKYEREDEDNPVGYEFLVSPERDTLNLSVRAPFGMFKEKVIRPNNVLLLLKKMDEFDNNANSISVKDLIQ